MDDHDDLGRREALGLFAAAFAALFFPDDAEAQRGERRRERRRDRRQERRQRRRERRWRRRARRARRRARARVRRRVRRQRRRGRDVIIVPTDIDVEDELIMPDDKVVYVLDTTPSAVIVEDETGAEVTIQVVFEGNL
ncbi:MAG: hypothetical protein VYE22_18975 [Myxococcota bacterium]|nr:hypothetical protein [Myxococcota bacterium]